MDDGQQDQYEERLKEVFESFDASGAGLLCPEELSSLCQALHLEDSTPTLLHALLQNQDPLTDRVDFDQFKNALILVLSTTTAVATSSQETTCAPPQPDSPVQAKFVRGSKRYGRRSTPEFIETIADFSEVLSSEATGQQEPENHDSTVPRKRERWNAHESSTDEYEADGQLHLWNPDDPSTPRGSTVPLSDRLEERLRQACEELAMPWDGCASHHELLALCDHLGLAVTEDVLQFLSGDEVMSVQAFTSWVLNQAKPPTPSASTPYRQLKRLHSSQPFDETGRRTSCMTSSIRMCLFSTLDDGTGSTPAEDVLDAWMEEGIENSPEILQALEFDPEGKVNLRELTVALENELLVTKNGIHQAALASFKAEIRYLLERVDHERREKEKIRSDLDKAEKLKTQLAAEVDEHHSAIERMNDLNLRKLEQEHREKLVSVRSELIKEMDQIQQQKEKLEAEMEKIRDDETFLRDHLSLTVKESRCLEMELLVSTEKLLTAESQVRELQKNLDNILKEKFGDLDPGSAEFFLQEERLGRLRSSYEEQCRELQDRIDELQAELQEYHDLGRTPQPCLKPSLSEELGSTSPGMESDPGLGLEEGQPLFNMSLEAEMMLERLKEKHLQEMEELQAQLESKVSEFDQKVEEQKTDLETQKAALSLHYMEEIQALHGEMSSSQNRALELRAQLEQAEEERAGLEQRQAGEMDELEQQQEEEVSSLEQQLLEARTQAATLGEQLLEARTQAATLDEQLLEARTQAATLDEQLLEARTQAATLDEQLLEARTQAATLDEQLLEARTQAASLDEQLLEARTQAASLDEQLLEARTQAASLDEQLLEARTQAASLDEQLLEARTQAASLDEQLLEARTQAASLDEQLLEARTQAASLDEQLLEARTQAASLDEQLLEARTQAASLDEQLLEARTQAASLDEQLLEARTQAASLDEQLLEAQQAKGELGLDTEMQELRKLHAAELNKLDEEHKENLLTRMEEERGKLQEERAEVEMRLLEEWEREKLELQQSHEETVKAGIEEVEMRLMEEWEREKLELQQSHEETVKAGIEEVEMRLMEEWEREKLELQQSHEETVKAGIEEVEMRLMEEREREKLELQQSHEETVKAGIEEVEMRLLEEWEREKLELQQSHEETVKAGIEEVEMRLLEEWVREKLELQQSHEETVKAGIEEVEMRLLEEWEREKLELQQSHEETMKAGIEEVEMRLMEEREREKLELQQSHEETMKAGIEEVEMRLMEEREREKLELQQSHEETMKAGIEEVEMRLMEEWEREKAQLNKKSNESLQTMLEEAMLRLVKEQQNREARLTEQWELERARLQQCREAALLTRLAEERLKQQEETERRLREDWDRERLQLEEEYEGVFQERLQEERQSLKEAHRRAMQELSAKNHEEREQLSSLLDKLREDIAEERREVGRLVEENLLLTQKMSTLKEESLKDSQKEMLFKLEHFRKEKISAQKKAESFKRKISVLRLRSQQLEDENGLLSEKNAQNAAGVEALSQQLGELLRQSERHEAVRDQHRTVPEDERMKMAVCVTALEAELANAVEGTVLLEEGKAQLVLQLNTLRDEVAKMGAVEGRLSSLLQERKALEKQTLGLRNQLAKSQERNQVLEKSLQSVDLQSARLKSDLRVSQQEKDALKQEVMSLHKQLQNGNDKNQVLEMALHSRGYQSQHKKLYQDELARLVEQEQQQLRQENERLTMELHHTREKLEVAILTVKQQKQQGQSSVGKTVEQQKQQGQSSMVKTVEQEKSALKRELDVMHQELLSAQNKVCEVQRELDSLRQENEGLKTRQAPLQAWLLEAQLGGLLPSSPRRTSGEWRGQHCENDHNPENIQGAAMPEQRAAHADSYRRIGGL